MNHIEHFNKVCSDMSALLTFRYSTSFSMGIKLFAKEVRAPICSIYGFVRLADEIVDTFHHVDKKKFLDQLTTEVKIAIETGFSINPILHAFAQVARKYEIDWDYIAAFLESMEMDLDQSTYSKEKYKYYIYGSAEVVGLFCLKVFLEKKPTRFKELEEQAKALGSAFQKINFLRDIKSDFEDRGRLYFPEVTYSAFSEMDKLSIEKDIEHDFTFGLEGIKKLPKSARIGVETAYYFYYRLFQKIKSSQVEDLLTRRIRVSNFEKFFILIKTVFQSRFW